MQKIRIEVTGSHTLKAFATSLDIAIVVFSKWHSLGHEEKFLAVVPFYCSSEKSLGVAVSVLFCSIEMPHAELYRCTNASNIRLVVVLEVALMSAAHLPRTYAEN